MARALLICAASWCLVVAVARTAHAAPPPIEWHAPPGCPSQSDVEAQIAAMLAGSLRAVAPGTRLEFAVVRDGDGWRLSGRLTGPDGPAERTLVARDCAALAQAAALIAAIAVDPEHVAPGEVPVPTDIPPGVPAPPDPPAIVPAPPGAPPAQTPDVPEDMPAGPAPAPAIDVGPAPAGDPPPVEPVSSARRARPAAELGLAAGLGLGALPKPAALLRLHVGARGRRFRAGARASAWLPREAAAPGHPEVGGRFWLVSGGVYGCGVLRPGKRVEFPLCGALDVGVLGGRGVGELMPARAARSPWLGLSAGPGVHVAVTRRLAVQAALEGLAVLARPRFEISGLGAPCCGQVVGGQLTAGLAVTLP